MTEYEEHRKRVESLPKPVKPPKDQDGMPGCGPHPGEREPTAEETANEVLGAVLGTWKSGDGSIGDLWLPLLAERFRAFEKRGYENGLIDDSSPWHLGFKAGAGQMREKYEFYLKAIERDRHEPDKVLCNLQSIRALPLVEE